MTLEELRQKPEGVLERRSIIVVSKKSKEFEEFYFLKKLRDNKYSLELSTYGYENVCEEDMVKLINDERLSDDWASDLFFLTPELSFLLDD